MRLPLAIFAAATALAGCHASQTTHDATRNAMPCETPQTAGGYGAPPPAPDMDARMMCMEDAWADSKRELAAARSDAMAEGREMPPEVDAEVDEVLTRKVGGATDADRLQQLRDAVSDARRLAEIASAG